MTGSIKRMDLPHIEDRQAPRASWNVLVKLTGVDVTVSQAPPAEVAEAALPVAA